METALEKEDIVAPGACKKASYEYRWGGLQTEESVDDLLGLRKSE